MVGTGFAYALSHKLDNILVKEGKEPYFVPGIKRHLNNYGLNETIKQMSDRLGIKDTVIPVDLLDTFSPKEKDELERSTGVSFNEAKKVWDYFHTINSEYQVSPLHSYSLWAGEISKFIETKDPFKTNNPK